MSEVHERIWLEPAPESNPEGRLWCQDNVWGEEATEYVLASDHTALQERVRRLEEENARLWDALKLSDAETRQWFIGDLIRKNGKLNRSEICEAFKISVAQASADIQKWLAANPGKASYNVHTKRYEGSADGQA